MVPIRIKHVFFYLIIAVVITLGALTAEAVFRALYPEFIDETHSDHITRGVNMQWRFYNDYGLNTRAPYANYRFVSDRSVMILCGDSITWGYGTTYEDLYWVQLQRMIDLLEVDSIEIVPSICGVTNALGTLHDFKSALPNQTVSHFMYQFNFNDIAPPPEEGAISDGRAELVHKWDWFADLARFRYEHLNKSTLLRVAQHYSGAWIRKTNGTCEERGIDALGAYTWSYGSRPYAEAAQKSWAQFEQHLTEFNKDIRSMGIKPVILVSPIEHDVDPMGLHEYIQHYNLDFSCATIDPREELHRIAKKLDIYLIDPTAYLLDRFERRVKEGNFTPFFFPADENHFTPVAARYIAEYTLSHYRHFAF